MDVMLAVLMAFLFIGVGMSLRPSDFAKGVSHPKAFIWTLLCQYFIVPAVSFGACLALSIPPPVALGIMIMTFCPSATSSDVYTFVFKGDIPFSVSLDAVSSVITPFTVPFFTMWAGQYLYGTTKEIKLPVGETIAKGILVIIVPMTIGMILRKITPVFAKRTKRPFEIFSSLVIMFVVVMLTTKNWKVISSNLFPAVPISIALVMFSLSLGPLGKRLFRIPERISRTISFQLSIQNGILPLFVATLLGMPEVLSGIGPYAITMLIVAYTWGYYREKMVPLNRFKGTALKAAA